MLVSALEACEKPDSRIFHRAAQRAGVLPQELLHVGDRDREDVEGAVQAGCLALKIDRNGEGGIGLKAILRRLEEDGALADGGRR
jgi:FMN phosphatase YigB (HAD superfamily)